MSQLETPAGGGGTQNVTFAPKARIDGTTIRIGSGVGDVATLTLPIQD